MLDFIKNMFFDVVIQIYIERWKFWSRLSVLHAKRKYRLTQTVLSKVYIKFSLLLPGIITLCECLISVY
jgi:hypothetical protein